MSSRFTQYILIAMALGIAMGTIVFNYLPDSRVEIAADVNLIAMLFLRLIKMIIAPLVFATLVGGIAHMGSGSKLGRIFAKTMGWFVSASFVSLLAVWATIMATVSKNGLGVLWKLIVFMGGFYLSLAILWGILVVVGFVALGPRYSHLLRLIREPLMIAFSTASSEAAYPKTLEGLNRFGASSRISSFVLPLGYSFNLDGTMMYCTFASIFIAQTYQIEMSLGTQLAMLATLMITSKGVAGVPRASLVVIASTLSQFGIPEAGLLMIMGIDTFLDMGRSAPNVIGNSPGTAVGGQGEGDLAPEA